VSLDELHHLLLCNDVVSIGLDQLILCNAITRILARDVTGDSNDDAHTNVDDSEDFAASPIVIGNHAIEHIL